MGDPQKTWTDTRPPARDKTSRSKTIFSRYEKSDANVYHVKQEQPFWPSDYLPRIVPPAQILTWGYESASEDLWLSTSHDRKRRHGERLLSDIINFRSLTNVSTKHSSPVFWL